jgi:Protein of unknown function (DUF2844)
VSSWIRVAGVGAWIGMAFLSPAWAALGQSEASVEADAIALSGTRSSRPAGSYTQHEIRLPSGTTIRQFAANNAVFGVAWAGPVRPDLQQLLGDCYGAALRASPKPRHRGPLSIRTSECVVESGGHMRDLRGRAYLPTKVPHDVALSSIR